MACVAMARHRHTVRLWAPMERTLFLIMLVIALEARSEGPDRLARALQVAAQVEKQATDAGVALEKSEAGKAVALLRAALRNAPQAKTARQRYDAAVELEFLSKEVSYLLSADERVGEMDQDGSPPVEARLACTLARESYPWTRCRVDSDCVLVRFNCLSRVVEKARLSEHERLAKGCEKIPCAATPEFPATELAVCEQGSCRIRSFPEVEDPVSACLVREAERAPQKKRRLTLQVLVDEQHRVVSVTPAEREWTGSELVSCLSQEFHRSVWPKLNVGTFDVPLMIGPVAKRRPVENSNVYTPTPPPAPLKKVEVKSTGPSD